MLLCSALHLGFKKKVDLSELSKKSILMESFKYVNVMLYW